MRDLETRAEGATPVWGGATFHGTAALMEVLPEAHGDRFVVPRAITIEQLEGCKRRARVLLPKGVRYKDFYPSIVLSYASGRRTKRKDAADDCEGSGPGVMYAMGLMEFLHERGLQCFSGLQVPPGVDWETFMLRLTGENGKREKPKVLIIILTAGLYQSKPCLKEISTAIENKIALLPVRFEDNLPAKEEQWTNLDDPDWEMMKFHVQAKLNKLNNIPNPGTVLTRASALDDVMAEIEKYLPTSDAPVEAPIEARPASAAAAAAEVDAVVGWSTPQLKEFLVQHGVVMGGFVEKRELIDEVQRLKREAIEARPAKHTAQPPTPIPLGGATPSTRFPVGYKIHVEDVEHVSQLRQLPPGQIGKLPKNLSLHDKLILEVPSHVVRVDGVAPAAIAAMSCDEAATWTGLQILHMTREQLMAITEQQVDSLPRSTLTYVKNNFKYTEGKILGSQIAKSKRFEKQAIPYFSSPCRGEDKVKDFLPTIGESPDEFVARAEVALRVPQQDYMTPKFHDQFTFEYGELVLVRRSSGALNYAQVVSNASGLHVLEWSVEEVADWAASCSVKAAVKEIGDGHTLMHVTQRWLREGETHVIKDLQELGVPAIHGKNLLIKAMALRLPTCLFNRRPSTQAVICSKRKQPMDIERVTIEQMKAAGFSPSSCKWAGFTLADLVSAQHLSPDVCSAREARDAGATPEQMKAYGFSPCACKKAGFTLAELVSAQHLSPDVCSAQEARDAGATKEQMKAAGLLQKATRELFEAAKAGKNDELKTLIDVGGDVCWKNPSEDGMTALHCAALEGHLACVKTLLHAKVRLVDILTSTKGATALHSAAAGGHVNCIEALLRAKVRLDATTSDGDTALHIAARLSKLDAVKRLLAAGARTAIRNKAGQAALDIARWRAKMAEKAETAEKAEGHILGIALHLEAAEKAEDVLGGGSAAASGSAGGSATVNPRCAPCCCCCLERALVGTAARLGWALAGRPSHDPRATADGARGRRELPVAVGRRAPGDSGQKRYREYKGYLFVPCL